VVHDKRGSCLRSLVSVVVAAALLGGLVFLIFFGDSGRLALGPCVSGRDGAAMGTSGDVADLLETRNFEASRKAIGDLKGGIVDERLVSTLQTITEEHRVCVDAFKEGHYFLPGVLDGPLIPDSYGNVGGLPNSHYYGRAVDVRRVNGKSVSGNGTDPDVLNIGEILSRVPPQERPDQIIGPKSWAEALGRSSEEGWILEDDQLALHEDHLHLGYTSEDETLNTQQSGSGPEAGERYGRIAQIDWNPAKEDRGGVEHTVRNELYVTRLSAGQTGPGKVRSFATGTKPSPKPLPLMHAEYFSVS
jgi:hypothetical protein